MTEQTVPKSLMEQAFQTHRESLKLVGDHARGSRAKLDTLAFAAWILTDIVATSKVFEEACKAQLTSEELTDSYSSSLRSNIKAVLFSSKADVKAIAEEYKRGTYRVGIQAAAKMARGTVTRDKAVDNGPGAPAENKQENTTTTPAKSPVQQIESLLEGLTVADLRIVAEMVQAKLVALNTAKAA